MSPKRFHIASFGCRASQSEGAAIDDELLGAGARSTASPYDADVVVVNSCTVTAEADRDVERLIRRVSRRNPGARIIVTGCYAQRDPERLAAMPAVSHVVGNSHKAIVGRLALESLEDPAGPGRAEIFCSDIFGEKTLDPAPHQGSTGRTRATVKVQDGCDANCAFCIIPAVRGRGRSLEPAAVIAQVGDLVRRGYREVVLSGIHLGSYGRDLDPRTSFPALVGDLLAALPGLERLRLSSIEPLEVTGELLDLVATHPRVARHLHVPMQSGSTRVLRAMRRPYTADRYAALLEQIRRAMPGAAIGADVMVGFPGETDADFLETYRLIEASPLTYLHVFPYSERPGTAAATLADPVPGHVTRFRGRELRRLIAGKNEMFRRAFVGRELPALVLDEPSRDGRRPAITDNFVKASAPERLEPNRWHRMRVAGLEKNGFRLEPVR